MKASTIIWYIVIAAVLYYFIYKAYTNYKISGSIFSSQRLPTGADVMYQNPAGTPSNQLLY